MFVPRSRLHGSSCNFGPSPRPHTATFVSRLCGLLSEPNRRARAALLSERYRGVLRRNSPGCWLPRSAAATGHPGQPTPKQGSEGSLKPCRQAFWCPEPRPGFFSWGFSAQASVFLQQNCAPARHRVLFAPYDRFWTVSHHPLPPPAFARCDGPSRPRPGGCAKSSAGERALADKTLFQWERGGETPRTPALPAFE